MSKHKKSTRCKTCELHWAYENENFGLTCDGNQNVSKCIKSLRSLITALRNELEGYRSIGSVKLLQEVVEEWISMLEDRRNDEGSIDFDAC